MLIEDDLYFFHKFNCENVILRFGFLKSQKVLSYASFDER